MATSTFDKIDPNQIATQRQVYGVACHFANIYAKSPSERFGATKMFHAILNKYYSDSDSYMTHSDVSEWREWDCVPDQFLSMISKPKALKRAKAKAKAKPSKKPTASKKSTTSKKSNATLTQRVEAMEANQALLVETQTKILELLEALK